MPGGRSQFERFAGRTPWKNRWYSTLAARHGKHDRENLSWKTYPCKTGFSKKWKCGSKSRATYVWRGIKQAMTTEWEKHRSQNEGKRKSPLLESFVPKGVDWPCTDITMHRKAIQIHTDAHGSGGLSLLRALCRNMILPPPCDQNTPFVYATNFTEF